MYIDFCKTALVGSDSIGFAAPKYGHLIVQLSILIYFQQLNNSDG
jgi:hypothetical protein